MSRVVKFTLFLLCVAAVSACARKAPPPISVDPLEVENRKVHLANRNLDQFIVRPTSNVYGKGLPGPVRVGIGNFSSNLGMPGNIVNDLLQFRIEDAGSNALRFMLNTTLGFGGLIDVATEAGLAERRTDFGETLYVWGAPEGNYIELPLIGPSTERHAIGRVVDVIINPVNLVFPSPENTYAAATNVAARFGDRYRLSEFVDSVLYESEDSYAQARLLYLQNRRFKLTGEQEAAPDYFDPYEDIYGEE